MDEPDAPIGATIWRREVAIAAGLLAFGLILLPFVVYLVGQRVLGEYEGDGALALAESIWRDLLSFRLAAWILVLSPYLTIQIARGVGLIWRRKL